MSERRTIIIGGGLAGVATLFELSRRGVSVLLLESADELATGASYANGGMLTPSMSDPWNGPGVGEALLASLFDPYAAMKLRLHALPSLIGWGLRFLLNSTPSRHAATTLNAFTLAQRSLELTVTWERELGVPFDFSTAGTLKVFATRAAAAGPIALANKLGPLGLRYEVLDGNALVDREPELREAASAFACGIYYPDDACGDARAFTRSLAARAMREGAQVRTGVAVKDVQIRNGRVVGVQTEGEFLPATDVVISAGYRSARLARRVGLSFPITPAKGYSVTIDATGWNARPTMPVVDDAMHAAVSPIGPNLRCVGTAEFAGDDVSVDQARIDNLINLFGRLYPHLAPNIDRTRAQPWAGLRPMSADGLPFVGSAGPAGLWINAGHGHLGWTMAAGSAELLGDLMLKTKPKLDPTPFRASR